MSVGKSVPHDSAKSHVKGESIFIDDRPRLPNEVEVGILGAPLVKGKILSIDFTKALKVPGIIAGYTHEDLFNNVWGTIVKEQPILAFDQVMYRGEPIAILAAEQGAELERALELIEVKFEEQEANLTLEEGMKSKDFIYQATPFTQGDFEKAYQASAYQIEDIFECGGQEHFYMENQSAITYPMEDGQLEVHSSSQHPTETQHVVAKALGLPFHEVVSKVKRMGGAFGGKESQAAPLAALSALVAQKLKRPARLVLTKDQDMEITGRRHPFKNYFKVGFDDNGKILAFKADLYANAGAYADLTSSILERAMFHLDGAYFLENVVINGTAVRTNVPSNTAFRGFGGPQGNMTIEVAMEKMANKLGKDACEIRKLNCYGKGKRNVTPYGQVIDHNPLPELFEELEKSSTYKTRRQEVEKFNASNNTKMRGLSLTATKFGIAFTARFLNQGNALVNLHVDGTIQVSTGATEMGQGVNTKIAQVVANCFSIPVSSVRVMTTSTEKNHNTSPTAASSGSDINCAAALKASLLIQERLKEVAIKYFNDEPFDDLHEYEISGEFNSDVIEFIEGEVLLKEEGNILKKAPFKKICEVAYLNRVQLGQYAFFKTENIGFDKQKGTGKPFNYFTNGVAATEVEIDRFTGEMKVLRTDILMDLGRPINPGIDQGQVTGAFIQGMGWVTQESLVTNDQGRLLTHSPTTYKIPNIQDTPRVFKIDFIENNENKQAVLRSKAVGEPPFLLGISCYTAILDALKYACPGKKIEMSSPATNEKILMAMHSS